MLNKILEDSHEVFNAQNSNETLRTDIDYDNEIKKRSDAVEKWKALQGNERKKYNNKLENLFKESGVIDVNTGEYIGAKHYRLIKNEVAERIKNPNRLGSLPINELHFEQALLELVENLENTEHIKELYKLRKLTVGETKNAGIKDDESVRLKNCLRQGRELYLSGKLGSLLVKPLNFFYSVTAYAYAIIILNNPIRYSIDNLPGSHGIDYLPDGFKISFGGNMPHGTFSELVYSAPTIQVRNKSFDIIQDNTETLLNFFKKRHTVSLGCLLSLIPEIREYYKLITGRNSRTHPMDITLGNDPRNVKWEIQIGDGDVIPPIDDVERAFPGMKTSNRYGKLVVEVPASESHKIRAMIFVDASGEFWYVQNPFFPVVLPETCIHFMLTSSYSNIMRYSPDHWGNILLNEISSDVSLITRKYLSAFENKFPILALRSISRFYPYIS